MQSSRETLFVDPLEMTTMKNAPELNDGEDYHIFISYSNTDSAWARGLIQDLEHAIPNLKACYHERDFLPGKTIVENMSTAIQRSQKVLLVLSRDFVRSRWCLMEANLSVFQESMHRKPVIPLMREHCSIPLHLTHLTYLDTKDNNFFAKIMSVICSSNQSLKNATLVPYQPLSLYDGKPLVCLPAVNEHNLENYDGSTFSETIPDELSMVLDDKVYRKAVHIINKTSCRSVKCQHVLSILSGFVGGIMLIIWLNYLISCLPRAQCVDEQHYLSFWVILALGIFFIIICIYLRNTIEKGRHQKMSRAAGLANSLLVKKSILVGCESRLKLHFLYISLTKCKKEFMKTFNSDQQLAEEMFQRALNYYSSSYTCCVAQKHFPSAFSNLKDGHMESVPCFCQYVYTAQKQSCVTLALFKKCLINCLVIMGIIFLFFMTFIFRYAGELLPRLNT